MKRGYLAWSLAVVLLKDSNLRVARGWVTGFLWPESSLGQTPWTGPACNGLRSSLCFSPLWLQPFLLCSLRTVVCLRAGWSAFYFLPEFDLCSFSQVLILVHSDLSLLSWTGFTFWASNPVGTFPGHLCASSLQGWPSWRIQCLWPWGAMAIASVVLWVPRLAMAN